MIELAGYDDLERIGSGGFSTVYRARQLGFGRTVAVKVLEGGLGDESQRESFEREVRAMGVVSQHPHIVTVFTSAYSAGGRPCIVMEFYQEGTLAERIDDIGALEASDVLEMGVKLASALQTAHDRGILHQDVKPQNIFLSEFGQPALGDFGISSILGDRVSESAGLTLHYASPERIMKEPATPSSDLYSLAATLYRAVAGRRPFDHRDPDHQQSAQELARRVLAEEPPRLDASAVPSLVQDALLRGLAKRPADRHRTALDFAQHLRAVQRQLGLAPTPLIVQGAKPETIDFDLDVEPPHSDLDGHTPKIADSQPAVDASAPRRLFAGLLALIAVAAVVFGVVVAVDRSPDVDKSPVVPEQLPGVLRPPYDVAIRRLGPTSVSVSWESDQADSADEVTYEVQRVGSDPTATNRVVTSSTRSAEMEVDLNRTVCVVVRSSIESLGRISDDSPITCLDG